MMRAWVVHELEELSFEDAWPEPVLDPDDQHAVVVDVAAAAPNFADSLMVAGSYQERPALPFVPGLELAGEVVATNSDLVNAGQAVVGLAKVGAGAWAERALCDGRQLTVLPDDIDPAVAAAIHVNAQTAWFALHRQGRLVPADTVLVHAAAGGVGSMAVQLAVAAGARVLATASAGKRDAVLRLGATDCYDNRDPGWPELVREATRGRGVDLVIELVGGAVFAESWRLLRFEGRLVTVGFTSGEIPSVQANHALVKNVSLVGVYWARYGMEAHDLVDRAADEIWRLYRAGRIDPFITAEAPMGEAPARSHAIAAGATMGKTILTW